MNQLNAFLKPVSLNYIYYFGDKLVYPWSVFHLPQATFFNVGQGDMSLFISSTGTAFLIDCFVNNNTVDSLAQKIVLKLKESYLQKIDCFIITHFHQDHYNGCGALLDVLKNKYSVTVKYVLIPWGMSQLFIQNNKIPKVKRLLRSLNFSYRPHIHSISGKNLILNTHNSIIFCCAPSKTEQGQKINLKNQNLNSIVTFILEKNLFKQPVLYIFPGDADKRQILRYLNEFLNYIQTNTQNLFQLFLNLNRVVLKVSHHGSKTGTDQRLLDEIQNLVIHPSVNIDYFSEFFPKISFVSSGDYNRYNHPHKEVINYLNDTNPSFSNYASSCSNTRKINNLLKKERKSKLNLVMYQFES